MSPTLRPKRGVPYRLPRIRWSEPPPKPVKPVRGQLELPLEHPEEATGPS